jgi:aspartyl-tRNA(Asn)/glutamyl-tRNA(Gln) amidotransferase subunit C
MSLTREDVLRLSQLTRISLSDAEVERASGELDRILGYIDRLGRVPTDGVPEVETTTDHRPLRADVTSNDTSVHDAILKEFPDHLASALRVPAVFANPKK